MKHAKKQTKSAGKARKATKPAAAAVAPKAPRVKVRDPRLPAAGTTLVRPYKGKDYRVTVLEEGFRYDGREFRSLSALASEITSQEFINGYLWFRLTGGSFVTPRAKTPKSKGKTPPASVTSPASDPTSDAASA